MLLGQGIDQFLEVQRSKHSPGYVRDMGYTLEGLRQTIGNVSMMKLRPDDFEKHFYSKKMGENTGSTFNKKITHVRMFLDWSQRKGWCPGGLLADVVVKKTTKRVMPRLPVVRISDLLETARNPRDRCSFAVVANTGMRVSGLRTIKLKGVDLDGGWLTFYSPKTKTEERFPISADLESELRRYLTWYAGHLQEIGLGWNPEWFLLPAGKQHPPSVTPTWRLRPDRPQSPEMLQGIMKAALRRIGFVERWGAWHALRRGGADAVKALAELDGIDDPVGVTQAFLQHSHRATTERYLDLTVNQNRRNRLVRGKSFISRLAGQGDNVIPLKKVDDGQA